MMVLREGGTLVLPQGIVQIQSGANSVLQFDSTAPAPDLRVGDIITIAGVTPTGFNGNYTITAVQGARLFQTNVAHSTTFTDTDNPVFPSYHTYRGLRATDDIIGRIYPADRCTWQQSYSQTETQYEISNAVFYQGAGNIATIPIIEAQLGYIGKSGRFVKIAN